MIPVLQDWLDDDMEDDPRLTINNDGEMIPFTRRNTALFTFLGEWAAHNHIFVVCDELEDENYDPEEEFDCAYIWSDNEMYEPLCKFMGANQFLMHLNLPKPCQADREAYQRRIDYLDFSPGDSDG